MSIVHNGLTSHPYFNPPTNYIGTGLFLSYIAIPLYVLARILFNLAPRISRLHKSASPYTPIILVFSTFSTMALAALSYNMITVLTTSYARYCHSRGVDLIPELAGGSASRWTSQVGSRLWQWMLHTTLFIDFAHDLLRPGLPWAWAQTALVWTMVVCLFLGDGERLRSTSQSKSGINLGFLFIVGQILPVSFALLIGLTDDLIRRGELCDDRDVSAKPGSSSHHLEIGSKSSTTASALLSATVIAYVAVLRSLSPGPSELPGSRLGISIIALRSCLVVPYYLASTSTSSSAMLQRRTVYGVFAATSIPALTATWSTALQDGAGLPTIVDALWKDASPPVRAVGVDCVIGILSSIVWCMISPAHEVA